MFCLRQDKRQGAPAFRATNIRRQRKSTFPTRIFRFNSMIIFAGIGSFEFLEYLLVLDVVDWSCYVKGSITSNYNWSIVVNILMLFAHIWEVIRASSNADFCKQKPAEYLKRGHCCEEDFLFTIKLTKKVVCQIWNRKVFFSMHLFYISLCVYKM